MLIKTSFGEYHQNGIYLHRKTGKYYVIESVSKLHDSNNVFLINYHQVDEHGVYQTIRENIGTEKETIVHQPFATHETRWHDDVAVNDIIGKRFEFVRMRTN